MKVYYVKVPTLYLRWYKHPSKAYGNKLNLYTINPKATIERTEKKSYG